MRFYETRTLQHKVGRHAILLLSRFGPIAPLRELCGPRNTAGDLYDHSVRSREASPADIAQPDVSLTAHSSGNGEMREPSVNRSERITNRRRLGALG